MDDHELISDECNLLYVAATRAKQCLVLNHTLVNILAKAKDHFLYLQPKEMVNFLCCLANPVYHYIQNFVFYVVPILHLKSILMLTFRQLTVIV